MTRLSIEAAWERLDLGPAEERACSAAIGIRFGEEWLTQAEDVFVKRVRDQVHLSGYKLAEWLAWNWWRLRWEPRRSGAEWALAHRMPTIGGGFVWPNIEIRSDTERVLLTAKPTRKVAAEPLRYLADTTAGMPADEWENALDRFIDQVRGQLRAEGVVDTNLDRIWDDVLAERADKTAALQRRFEAMLGYDPDEASSELVDQCIADAQALGTGAFAEIAGASQSSGLLMTAADLRQIARTDGFGASWLDAVRLPELDRERPGTSPAWRRGVGLAMALRRQEQLGDGPVGDAALAALTGTSEGVLQSTKSSGAFSFALAESSSGGRLALRSRWGSGRRFELGRLLGDRLAQPVVERLLPATNAATYRQKLQRAFAAEFLCPIASLRDMLGDDTSGEAMLEASQRFQVSELVVRSQLVSHGLLDRDALERDEASEGAEPGIRAA